MSRLGLVLAGGGLAGIAWETGILRGITDEAPAAAKALLDADVLLGTSAGSTVAAQIGSGVGIDELYERQSVEATYEIDSGVSVDDITALFLSAMLTPDTTAAQKLQRIGAIALATDTVAGPVRRAVIEQRLPSHDWPDRVLRITGIAIATGELVVFDNDSGVELVDAVAASCAVPGAWPPVRISSPTGERLFIDGGVGSTVNMVAANDCDAVVVLVPSGRDAPSPFSGGAAAEIDDFPGAALALFADDDALAAFGPNPLDPQCRIPSARAGREQGRRQAAAVADFLNL
ncbi:patatin-like phospholipase family protein [soil metagenome]